MSNVYEECPVISNDRWQLRFVRKEDAEDLLSVYSDKNALPFFNSDNCDGDNFYYSTIEKMNSALDFWLYSYRDRWFVRWAIVDRKNGKAVGTIELFRRISDDETNGMGTLRLDVRSDYENAEDLTEILNLIIPEAYDLFECDAVITKVPVYAVERMKAATDAGFIKTDIILYGDDGTAYNNYWKIVRAE